MESLKTRKFLAPSDCLSYKKIGTQLNNFSLINKFVFCLRKKRSNEKFFGMGRILKLDIQISERRHHSFNQIKTKIVGYMV